MSSNRHGAPLIAYSLSPLRHNVRVIVTSVKSIGMSPAPLSIVRLTSARPRAGRLAVPAKMTSSIFPERTVRGPCAPRTHATASTMLDFPDPLGPTTTVAAPPGGGMSPLAGAAPEVRALGDHGAFERARALRALGLPVHLVEGLVAAGAPRQVHVLAV